MHFVLQDEYSLNECINSHNVNGTVCPVECTKEENIIGKRWMMPSYGNLLSEMFQLEQDPTEYTFLDIVFLRLKKTVVKEVAVKLLSSSSM